MELDTKNFLTRVFAQRDELVVATWKPDPAGNLKNGFFWNRGSFSNIDDAVAAISQWDQEKETTVYFGVGAFAGHDYVDVNGRKKWRRTQDKATWFKALALDLDIGSDKPYATQKEGWAALRLALAAINFPTPMVISSGRGLHCYWPLTTPISAEHWTKASTALRIALEENDVVIDTTKIHDTSMVLRPVGTYHKKQQPWKLVECKLDCPDYDPIQLFTTLKPWFGKATKQRPTQKTTKSSIASAVLNTNDVIVSVVGQHCKQIRALLSSGGVTDASGSPVQEPMWRASLGLAKHATDVKEAVIMLAGKHPDFDLNDSMNKMAGWKGTGPTTCAKFEQLCMEGCKGCPHKGKITSPAQLSSSPTSTVIDEQGEAIEIELPKPYVEKDNKIFKEVSIETEVTDANGNAATVTTTDWELISPYPMHITGVYKDGVSGKTTFRLAIKYPMTGWQEEDHEVSVIATIGKDFATFLLNRQVFGLKGVGQQEKLRGYLMDYLTMVQQQSPTGVDFVAFGWQDDESFLCGEKIINSPTGSTDRRLRGAASRYSEIIKPHGDRQTWIDAMNMLNEPGTHTLRSAIVLALSGLLGKVSGNASLVVSIYSTETTTGKTLALMGANSLIGHPRDLFMTKLDTSNALFKIRGVLNNLPCTIDELTTASDEDVADLAYNLSQGREKISMSKDREIREPVKWDGPTLITTNISLHQKFDNVQTSNDPLRARVIELHHHDRTFIETDATGYSNGYRFFDLIAKNNGWAYPELVEAVVAMGGPELVYKKGVDAFQRRFNFMFEPQERFYRSGIINGWIIAKIGQKLGLLPFDVDATTQYLIDCVKQTRKDTEASKQDVFDTIGQFLQEHNDQLIEVTEVYGSAKEQVHIPAPERAVARIKVVYDSNTPVMPGSNLTINLSALKRWLSKTRVGVDRVVRELEQNGALISARERVTMFKGCHNRNPGQAHCLIVNINHPRFVDALTSTSARLQSPVALAVLQGGQA
jgi:hypothetical protein